MVYDWKPNAKSRLKADANLVKRELDGIGENITAEEVVRFAESNHESELHKCFEWDDGAAAHQYRLIEARFIVRSIVIVKIPQAEAKPQEISLTSVPSEDEPMVRAYTHLITEGKRQYMPTPKVVADEDLLRQAFRTISDGISALERKAKSYEFLRSHEMDSIHKKLEEAGKIARSVINKQGSASQARSAATL